jgi:hypothetical protein
MTQADFDSMVRSNPTWNEPMTIGEWTDCYSELELDGRGPPYFLRELAATDSQGRTYSASFVLEGARMVADSVSYTSRLVPAAWERHLADSEKRFGKADWVGLDGSYPQALWCSPGEVKCTGGNQGYLAGPNLTIKFFRHQKGETEAGDRLDYELRRGKAARDTAYAASNALIDRANPGKRAALLARCRNAPGGFADRRAIVRHYASLAPLGGVTSSVITSPHAIPAGVFAAIGIDSGKAFAKGVCFNSMDFVIEDEARCPGGQTSTNFRWARKVGNIWLLSLNTGGGILRYPYFAVREVAKGNYRKVWWTLPSEGLASFNAWRTNGAVPMTEPLTIDD